MKKHYFFKPTALYKEFIILDGIEANAKITQRDLASISFSSVSMVNLYLDSFEKSEYVIRKYNSSKNVEYYITDKGRERKKVLNIGYLHEMQKRYKEAKKETESFINKIIEKGFKNIIFYGAGEVAEIFIQAINDDFNDKLQITAVIDDDTNKQGKQIGNMVINKSDIIKNTNHDAIMIVTYNNYEIIYNKLMAINYPKDKILYFFD